mmetsp:Transcript_25575/g.64449  ORF Transcript_25575/g.64449 Transcript_25575/m.64449 type:complete len:261 (-) Transcript_25575:323-1105(-)
MYSDSRFTRYRSIATPGVFHWNFNLLPLSHASIFSSPALCTPLCCGDVSDEGVLTIVWPQSTMCTSEWVGWENPPTWFSTACSARKFSPIAPLFKLISASMRCFKTCISWFPEIVASAALNATSLPGVVVNSNEIFVSSYSSLGTLSEFSCWCSARTRYCMPVWLSPAGFGFRYPQWKLDTAQLSRSEDAKSATLLPSSASRTPASAPAHNACRRGRLLYTADSMSAFAATSMSTFAFTFTTVTDVTKRSAAGLPLVSGV